MTASQIIAELIPKYVGLLAQIAEFLVVAGAHRRLRSVRAR
ncbi:hypothetical protein [Halorubrum sp. AS12]